MSRQVNRLACGLALAAALCGCGDGEPSPPTGRYPGPIAPCDVQISSEQPDEGGPVRSSAAPDYWKPGPYAVWNTSPAQACLDDPTIAQVGDQRNIGLYITYPAASEPTVTGEGDVAPGKWPVIVFAHANSDRECNIYRRYFSLHDHWASWGFVVAAVDQTYTNCRPGNTENIEKRVASQMAALDELRSMNDDPTSRFYGRIDTDTVVFAGHSRGGGASLLSAERHGTAAGVIDIQGIDLTAFGFGADTLPDFPVVGFTAGEDVDLNYPLVEPTEDQLGGPYTWVNINGGIHAYTADTAPIEPDDVPLIEREQQHDITEYYSTAFLARWVGVGGAGPQASADEVLFSPDASYIVDEEISELGVYQRWRSPAEATWIETFDGIMLDTNLTGGPNACEGLARCEQVATYQPDRGNPWGMYRKATSLLLGSDGPAGSFRMEVDGGLTLPEGATLQARVKGPDLGEPADFTVTAEFADGSAVTVFHPRYIGAEPLSNRFTQFFAPLDNRSGMTLTAVEIEVAGGALFVDDVRVVGGVSRP